MREYIIKRLFMAVLIILGVITITFMLVYLSADPVSRANHSATKCNEIGDNLDHNIWCTQKSCPVSYSVPGQDWSLVSIIYRGR